MSHRILRTNHVGFTVTDLDRSIGMFIQLFGYELESRGGRNPRGVAMLTGVEGADIMVAHLRREGLVGIELIAYHGPSDRDRATGRACDTGYTHLTYDVRDLTGFLEEAAGFGLVPVGQVVENKRGEAAGMKVVYLRDPDGINIELIQQPGSDPREADADQ